MQHHEKKILLGGKIIILDLPGFDPGASRMQTVHSTD